MAATGITIASCSPGGGLGLNNSTGPGAAGGSRGALSFDPARTLISYFSVPLTDQSANNREDVENSMHVVDGNVLGNTEYVAQLIQERTGAQLFRIETAQSLPVSMDTLTDEAEVEQEENARPGVKAPISDLAAYDTIFIGYPIWWYDLPMVLYTFLEQHDFTGKNIVLFSTHGGSRLSGTVETITAALSGAAVNQNAFTISRDDMHDAPGEVDSWLGSLN
ncbi:flavodoxin [Pseudarthrobacter sp. DSP2-3-2b1]|uniref:flavodoxin n=1 Tax=Pseudarthrobacter sp. DSP2-3-2b1 TaxID=2804661 RepID=UPI003CF93D59